MSAILKGIIKQNVNLADTYEDKDAFIDALAEGLAAAIQSYLQSNVTVTPGQVVITAGTAATQRGATTTPGTLIAR